MAYSVSNPPKCVVTSIGGGPQVWHYASTDVHTDVDAAGYFTNGQALGMRVQDIVFVIETDNSGATTIHSVTAISSGAASISTAVLA